jgi:uncharacterized repeat protein (TIGR01451 family)
MHLESGINTKSKSKNASPTVMSNSENETMDNQPNSIRKSMKSLFFAALSLACANSILAQKVRPEDLHGRWSIGGDSIVCSSGAVLIEENEIVQAPDEMPAYPGGAPELQKWLLKNLKTPKYAKGDVLPGKLNIILTVEKTGKISEVSVFGQRWPDGINKENEQRLLKMKNRLSSHMNLLRLLPSLLAFGVPFALAAQSMPTANDTVPPYAGGFHAAMNNGYYPGVTNEQLAELAAGNATVGLPGVGARAMRVGFTEEIAELFGYDILQDLFDYYGRLGMSDHTMLLYGPIDWHRDTAFHCPTARSALFSNLYTPIWDGGANGTPYNDDNYFAAYTYKMVSRYKPYVRFWEIWNEPGFDLTGGIGWQGPGAPGNWWENDPKPCDYILRAPVQHYIRTLHIAWEVVKTLDPDAYVTCSGVGYPAFLDALLRQTENPNGGAVTAEYPLRGGAWFDAVGFHSYPHIDGSVRYWDNTCQCMVNARHSDGATDGMLRTWGNYANVLKNHGYDGSVFPEKIRVITEGNVPGKQIFWGADPLLGGVELQRNFVVKAMTKLQQRGFAQYDLFQMFHRTGFEAANNPFDRMGVYEVPDAGQLPQRSEEGVAYHTVGLHLWRTQFDSMRTAAMMLPAGVDGAAFSTADGDYVYVLWAKTAADALESASNTYAFPMELGLGQLSLRRWDFSEGYATEVASAQGIALTESPIFLCENADWAVPLPDNTPKIDLSLSLVADPPNPLAGESTSLTLTLRNDGAVDATGVEVRDFLAFGKVFLQDRMRFQAALPPLGTAFDTLSGRWTVPLLPAGASLTLQVLVRPRHQGPYRLFAQVGRSDQKDVDSTPLNGSVNKTPFEDDEVDLILNDNFFTLTKADMVVEATVFDPLFEAGGTSMLRFMLRNNGKADAPASQYRIHLSTDELLSPDDTLLWEGTLSALVSYGYVPIEQSVSLPDSTLNGGHFLLFEADSGAGVDEFDENNVFARPIAVSGGISSVLSPMDGGIHLRALPNPFGQVLEVSGVGDLHVELLDIFGKTVRKGETKGGFLRFFTGDLPKGMYVLRAQTETVRLIRLVD